jgi:hypothetical protein
VCGGGFGVVGMKVVCLEIEEEKGVRGVVLIAK